jgi:hypothetical protein
MNPSKTLDELAQEYNALRNELAKINYISAGSIYRRPAGASGARCHWTTKDNDKTVSLALSPEQADWLEAAINEHRRVKAMLAEMHRLSRRIMLTKFPDAERRKPINSKVMRLI